jgi:hypothetical protein
LYDNLGHVVAACERCEGTGLAFTNRDVAARQQRRDITPAETEEAFDAAVPVPLSEERIQEIVACATGKPTDEERKRVWGLWWEKYYRNQPVNPCASQVEYPHGYDFLAGE